MKHFFTSISLLLLFLFNAALSAQTLNNDVELVVSAVNNGLQEYLNKIPAGQEASYGFKSRNEFTLATSGIPYHVYTLNDQFFSDTQLSEKNYLKALDEWRVPVKVNGENKTLLTISKMNGTWKIVDLGGTGLAKELAENELQLKKVQSGILFRVFQLTGDFILVPSGKTEDPYHIIPLTSAKMALQSKAVKELSTYTYLQMLILIKNNIPVKPQ